MYIAQTQFVDCLAAFDDEQMTAIAVDPAGSLVVFGLATGQLHFHRSGDLAQLLCYSVADVDNAAVASEVKDVALCCLPQGAVLVAVVLDNGEGFTLELRQRVGERGGLEVAAAATAIGKPRKDAAAMLRHCRCD
jgi:hypothetical protein